jgi:hypothetical protein
MNQFSDGAYISLAGVDFDGECMSFPRGIELRKTSLHITSPMLLDYRRPYSKEHLPRILQIGRQPSHQVTCELAIPADAAQNLNDQMEIASTAVFLLRLYADPSVTMLAVSNVSFSELYDCEGPYVVIPIQSGHRYFKLDTSEPDKVKPTVAGIPDLFDVAHRLRMDSAEFRTLTYAFETAQYLQDSALVLISLWGALEAIFSPSTSELRFRVSALMASYLHEAGPDRVAKQKRIASLYDKRSAAAHGKPKHAGDDVFETIVLARQVLLKCLEEAKVPSKESLDQRLFGNG